ncbi:unnamed protein product [Protopolystoma xenopodis]|uniref:Uncharacterized protein n=1 Tax=Protopolystoma xenopodis TaxID=117903 RepID=A0A448WYG4_9PLAT|nr:unnamed protein product [Protopolystoma xenopodis]
MLSNISDNRITGHELSCVDELLREIRHHLHPNNIRCFETFVESKIAQLVNPISAAMQIRLQAEADQQQEISQSQVPQPLQTMTHQSAASLGLGYTQRGSSATPYT